MNKYLDDLFLYPKSWVDDEAKGFAATARSWAEKEILSNRLEYQKRYDELFIEKRKKLMLDIGFERLVLPEEHGGYGWNKPSSAPGILTVFTEIGRADATIGFIKAVKYAAFATMTMQPHMDKALCDELAPLYFADQLKNVALILPGPGVANKETPLFHGRSIQAVIKAVQDGYSISGDNLRPLGPGKDADLLCVVCANKDGSPCIAFVPADAKGVKKGSLIKTTGLEGCGNADIKLDKVKVPKSTVITREGALQDLYAWLNLLLGGTSLGAAMNFFEILSDWAETRTIKGGSIMKENPLCASVLATVADEIVLARLLSYSLAHIMAQPEDWGGIGSEGVYTFAQMLGSRIQQACLNALNRGMELMGSAGYAKEWHVEKHWRDIKTIQSCLCGIGADVPVKMDIARFFYQCKEI
jgi:alkylation response protein AidB-like acyl-CoA dehydrogenase